MLKPETFEPNYHLIADSNIWKDQVDPMLETLYIDALEGSLQIGVMPRLADGRMPTTEDYHFWRGAAAALKMVRETVNAAAVIQQIEAATEKTDEYQGQYDDRRIADRRSRA